jgi:Ca-activated chloride channel family protein
MSKLFVLLSIFVCAFCTYSQTKTGPEITQGTLFAYDKKGKDLGDCPLKNTSVNTEISGFISRVKVRQEFENSFAFPIEAVYTFPLSQKGAVDDMTMTIGSRVIHAKIMKRKEARQVYEQAKTEGKTASLLDQERPNIFTQSVANILPGDKVIIEISYVETLKYEDGAYEFVFPMTVGPRYIPASGVADAAKIKPPYAATRNGSNISIEVNLNAGVPVEEIRSLSHDIAQANFAPNAARITLKNGTTIPNKDFVLRYDVAGGKIQDALLTHRDERGGFFTLILQPPDRITTDERTPKEIVFVLDTSGSMSGFPIEKAKEAMKLSIDGLYPDDTFNLITFAGDTSILFDGPVPATQENVEMAKAFIESRQGSGGTEMMKAIKAALDPSDSKDHLRIVCFMTDGYVGNENEIIAEIQKHPQARVFSFGIGGSVNRFLLDKMAEAGRGEVEYVALEDDDSKAAKKFYERVRTPLLTDLSIDWNGVAVSDVYPSKLTDLFSAKPVIVHGRFTKAASGVIRLKGKMAGVDQIREIAVNFPDSEPANDALASLWARTRIDELSSDSLRQANSSKSSEYDKQIEQLGLEYRMLTDFTSFVAVEDRVVNQNGKPVTVQVPVEVPAGVDPVMSGATSETVDVVSAGSTISSRQLKSLPSTSRSAQGLLTIQNGVVSTSNASVSSNRKSKPKSGSGSGSGNGVGYGQGSGSGSGGGNGSATLSTLPTTIGRNVAISEDDAPARATPSSSPETAEQLRIGRLKAKLHTWLYAVVERLAAGTTKPTDNESLFVRDGKATVELQLTNSPDDKLRAKLQSLGFEIVSIKDKRIVGRVALDKLADLAVIDEIGLVLPRVE